MSEVGRVVAQSNPTEITGGGYPAGKDAAGFRWTRQSYDWQGRPTITTYPSHDGTGASATTEVSYGGCGCAGGEVATVRDERERRKRYTKDALGRLAKVEEMNWLESEGVYATTSYTYNGRDQLTSINQAGQMRTLEYDGHGRLWKRTTPEQGLTTTQMRRYNGAQQRFSQPDPDDGSYSLADPQSFNRYSYVQNDPVNFTDPSGLDGFIYWFDDNGQFHGLHLVNGGTTNSGSGRVGGGGIGGGGSGLFGRIEIASEQNADGAGGGVGTQNLTLVPPPDFRTGINNLLNNPLCANFAHATIYEAASDTSQPLELPTVLGVFDKLNKSGNVAFRPGGVSSGGNGQVTGNFADGNARMEIAGRYLSSLPANPANARWIINVQQATEYSQTVLGETMHLAGRNRGFSDRQLAEAAFKVTRINGLPRDEKDTIANSLYFHHAVLRSICT
jgi:RHS repeat-associated protein